MVMRKLCGLRSCMLRLVVTSGLGIRYLMTVTLGVRIGRSDGMRRCVSLFPRGRLGRKMICGRVARRSLG